LQVSSGLNSLLAFGWLGQQIITAKQLVKVRLLRWRCVNAWAPELHARLGNDSGRARCNDFGCIVHGVKAYESSDRQARDRPP
jgi:hypothetical protein